MQRRRSRRSSDKRINVSRSAKIISKFFLVVVLVIIVWFAFAFVLPFVGLLRGFDRQMTAGQKYMDSLTEKDFQVWAARTQKYLSEFDPKACIIDAKPVPGELKQLKILRIDEDTNWVGYVWMGSGFDHTELVVQKIEDGSFQFTARYNDNSNRVIWPVANTANHSRSKTNLTVHLTQ